MRKSRILNNAIHLYVVTGIKVIVPILIMPYLSRVLSVNQYATYSYVRALATFVTLFMDFGFIYSGTKRVADCQGDKEGINIIISNITKAKILIFFFTLIIIYILLKHNYLTKQHFLFSVITIIATAAINLLPDYVFRGIEEMGALSYRMIVSKTITTALLFICVKSENDFLIVAILELVNTCISIVLTIIWLYKRGYKISVSRRIKDGISELKNSFDFFIYSVAPSMYGALNTVIIGNTLTEREIVYWSTSWGVISAIMNLYVPISNSVFPVMVKEKSIKLIRNILKLFLPIVLFGSAILIGCSRFVFLVLVGEQYVEGAYSLALLIPVLTFSFIAIMYGAPVLGALGKERELRNTSILTSVFHVFGLIALMISGYMSLINICVLRVISEIICAISRLRYAYVIRAER